MSDDTTTDDVIAAIAPIADEPIPAPTGLIRGFFGFWLRLFSSIWLGVTLLTLLFIYCSIGSAGLPIEAGVLKPPFILRPDAWMNVRELIEMSEFRWFHWWPFDVLIALICVNLVVTTLRRIPFKVVNLGVWMIHSGIIILALGSVWYFSAKVEGDAPVARRQVVAALPGEAPVTFIATPGNRVQVGTGANTHFLEVSEITPDWELLSGDDKGKRAYKVSVLVQSPTQMYIRELLAGYPQYTEDLVRSDDPNQPFARAKKTLGKPLVDETLDLSLDYHRQEHFFLMESAAVYLREAGTAEWVERPIRGMPRFFDHISSPNLVWFGGGERPDLHPIEIEVPAVDPNDPLPDVTFEISDFLRYATTKTERVPGGNQLNPSATLRFENDLGEAQSFELAALDPASNTLRGGVVEFRWATSQADIDALKEVRDPVLRIEVPGAQVAVDVPITELSAGAPDFPFSEIEGTDYSYRVKSYEDGLNISGRSLSVAMVEFRSSEPDARTIERWVFDQPAFTGDRYIDEELSSHAPGQLLDENIILSYTPGRRSGLRLVAGPGDDELRLLIPADRAGGTIEMVEQKITVDETVPIQPGINLTIARYSARSRSETRPFVVPLNQRDRDVGMQASMIRLLMKDDRTATAHWLPYHLYPFAGPQETLRRFRYQPSSVHLADGRHVEVIFSRERMKLPAPVVLEDFEFEQHIGGFTGSTVSIRNWTSVVRFAEDGGAWGEPMLVSVNDPQENNGFWFFQSQWDPPSGPTGPGDRGSAGLNYTVLGVGNREGVNVQLLGCCISVLGMIYAFYVKPVIKRRRRAAVYGGLAEATGAVGSGEIKDDAVELEPIGAAFGDPLREMEEPS